MSAPNTPNLSNVSADDFWNDLGIKPQEAEQATDYDGWTVTDIGVNPLIWHCIARDLTAAGADPKLLRAARNQHWSLVPWVSAAHGGTLTTMWRREPTSDRWGVDMTSSIVDLTNLHTPLRQAITSPVDGWHVAEIDWSCCHFQILAVKSEDPNMLADLADPAHPLRGSGKVAWLAALNGESGTEARAQLDELFKGSWKVGGAWLDDERVKLPDELSDGEKTARVLLQAEARYLDDACKLIHEAGMASNLLFPHRDALVIHGPADDLPDLAERVAGIMRSLLPLARIKGIGTNWGFIHPTDPNRPGSPVLPQQLVGMALDDRAISDLAILSSWLKYADSKSDVDKLRYILPMSVATYADDAARAMGRVDSRKIGKEQKQLIEEQREAIEWAQKQMSAGKPAIEDLASFPMTDAGTAALLESIHGCQLLPSTTKKDDWFCYEPTEGRWTFAHTGIGVTPRLSEVAKMALDSLCFSNDREYKKKAEAYYKSLGDDGKCSRVASFTWKMASSDPTRIVTLTDFDRGESVICVRNGTVDLRTGVLRPSTPEDRHSVMIDIDYDPSATCPHWEALIPRTMGHDATETAALTRLLGYFITGCTKPQKVFIFYGPTAGNGKGSILNVMFAILGGYASLVQTNTLSVASNMSATQPDLNKSWSARMLYVSEWKDQAKINDDTVKAITGGDAITVRGLYKDPITGVPLYKPVIACQHLPEMNAADGGLARRIVIIPFEVDMAELYPDLDLPAKLKAEHQGILTWLVRAAMAYYADGLQLAPKWLEHTEALRLESDPFEDFLREHYEIVKEPVVTPFTHIWQTYTLAGITNAELTKMSERAIGSKLRSIKGLRFVTMSDGKRGYRGLRPRSSHSPSVAPHPTPTESQVWED